MGHWKGTLSRTKILQTTFLLIAIYFIISLYFNGTRNKSAITFSTDIKSIQEPLTLYKKRILNSFSYGQNATHLWSMRLADENYSRLAHLLPCRSVEYAGGPQPSTINSCDQSSTNEYSVPNQLQAQKWIYEHQHPTDCKNKRFAIIHSFASSGFGSTVHQIAWAFGMTLADDRIAVYEKPGNWVRTIDILE